MSKLMFQETAGQRFVSFPSIAAEFVRTASREHSKYDTLTRQFEDAMEAALDGDHNDAKVVQPKTNFFWSHRDRVAVLEHRKGKKSEECALATLKRADTKARKQASRLKSKKARPVLAKEPKRTSSKKQSNKRKARSDDESSEDLEATIRGNSLIRTCSNLS
jgi:hypothetical protein